MTDPRELLERYAAEHVNDMNDRLDETVPEVIAAIRAVLDYCDEVKRTLPIASREIQGRITKALEPTDG